MCMMLNIPPAIEAGVVDYERSSGKTVEQVVIDYLTKEFAEQKKREMLARRFEEMVEHQTPLDGEPYKFRREDAYDEEHA